MKITLDIWCKENKKEYILDEWNYEKNGDLTPKNVAPKSHKKVWWICSVCGNEWEAVISSRAQHGCPECKKNRLKEVFSIPKEGESLIEKFPDIAEEWNYTRNGILAPENVSFKSHKKVWWKCDKGHEWEAIISNRTRSVGNGCPICSHKKIVSGINDLKTLNPKLAEEWNYEKNAGLLPEEVSPSSSKKVWWKCKKGHEWQSTINNRTKRGCPFCNYERKTSFPEKVIYYYINKRFNAIENYKPSWLFGKEIDIFIPELNIGIEYDGEAYHKDLNKDLDKNKICQNNGVNIIHVREPGCPSFYDGSNVYLRSRNEKDLEDGINELFKTISSLTLSPIQIPIINIDFDRAKIYEMMVLGDKNNSLAITHPNLAAEWHPEKNGDLTPYMVTKGSDKKVWWKCTNGHSWNVSVSHRVSGNKCPVCSGKRIISGQNDIQTLFPELMQEWDWDKNEQILPSKLGKSEARKVWWKCKVCGHSWNATVIGRVQGSKCPKCKK